MPEGAQLTQGVNPMLTAVAVSYLPDLTQFIGKQVFPNVPVGAPLGRYNIWHQDDFLRIQAKRLSNREAPPVVDFSTASGTFSVNNYGVSANWTDRELAEARIGGISSQTLENNKTYIVTMNGLLILEKETADLVQTSGNWSTTIAGVTSGPTPGSTFIQWDQTTSDPVGDITRLKRSMHLLTGFMPNTIIIPGIVMDSLKLNAGLIDRIKYTGTPGSPSQVTNQMIQDLFGIPRMLVPEGIYNSSPEGVARNLTYFWGKNVWIGYVAPAPGLTIPSAGYTFSWVGDESQGLPAGMDASGAGPQNMGAVQNADGLFIRRYDTNRPLLHWVNSELWSTPNVVGADLGGLMTAVIA